jgi:phage-related holin
MVQACKKSVTRGGVRGILQEGTYLLVVAVAHIIDKSVIEEGAVIKHCHLLVFVHEALYTQKSVTAASRTAKAKDVLEQLHNRSDKWIILT